MHDPIPLKVFFGKDYFEKLKKRLAMKYKSGNIQSIQAEVKPGSKIADVAHECMKIARAYKCIVTFKFAGKELKVDGETTMSGFIEVWNEAFVNEEK